MNITVYLGASNGNDQNLILASKNLVSGLVKMDIHLFMEVLNVA